MHLVTLAWGLTAILGKLITLGPVDLVVWRTLLAALGFGLLAVVAGRRLALPRAEALRLLGTGALLGLHWVLFFASARLATASVCLAAMPTGILWCSLIEPWVDGTRRWRFSELGVGAVIIGAVWMIYKVEFHHVGGFTVGLAAAALAALFVIANKHWAGRAHHLARGAWQMSGALLVTLGAAFLYAGAPPALPAPQDWLWLALLSGVCTVGAYAGYMVALGHLSVFTTNVIYNMEPVYGIVLAMLVLGAEERMSGGFYAGAAIILACVISVPWLKGRAERVEMA
ncbi:MAG TPA: DMT family transporter [Prosthecobacter sp.]|nr:DMT family transporter [Prosthecobacter sp.]HRK16757.1 DMT family transporter [Prosthecobacter sp.]